MLGPRHARRMDAWNIELLVVRHGGYGGGERRAISRDVQRGLLRRIRQGVYVERAPWDAAQGFDGDRERHIVAMRALAAVAPRPPVFSHWSAAVLHGLPFVGPHLDRVHVTVPDERERGIAGVAAHLFALVPEETVEVGSLLATSLPRTVVDVAGASSVSGGLVVADAALAAGLPRELLEQAVDLAGPRRSSARIADVVDLAHPGAESAAESETRWTMFRLGLAPQELQHEVWDRHGFVGSVDTWDPDVRAAGEVDGRQKYLDPAMARRGAGAAVYAEKQREDRLRAESSTFGRWGYAEACSPALLRPIVARMGLRPARWRPTIADYAAVARAARPRRFVPRRPSPRRADKPLRG